MQAIPTVTKEIGPYDPDSHDYPAYVVFEDGRKEYIGSRKTQHDASLLASDYIIGYYSDHHTPEAAARLIREELEQEGRHERLAAEMGGVWDVADTETDRVIDCHPTPEGAEHLARQKRQLHGEYNRYIVRPRDGGDPEATKEQLPIARYLETTAAQLWRDGYRKHIWIPDLTFTVEACDGCYQLLNHTIYARDATDWRAYAWCVLASLLKPGG